MKYLLTSSGLRNDAIADALSSLLQKPLSETDILFVPTAANTDGGDKRWLIENLKDFERYNFKSIDILDIAAVSKDVWQKRFQEKDVICIGGGNEKYLADVFARIGMKDFLATLPSTMVYMGISAGSMVTGTFMSDEVCAKVFPEEDFGATVADPMGIHDFIFIPHLDSSFFTHIRKDHLENLQDKFGARVYAVDDETALSIDGENLGIVGKGKTLVV